MPKKSIWLKRKLANAKRCLGRIKDAKDMAYSELFVAFEVIVRQLDKCTHAPSALGWNKPLREIVDDLHIAFVISQHQRTQMHHVITQRNSLFHGEDVDTERLPLEELHALVIDLDWYYTPTRKETK